MYNETRGSLIKLLEVLMKIALFTFLIALAATATGADITDEELSRLYEKPSVFESLPKTRWIAESKNAYVVHDGYPQAPKHMLVIPKKRIPTILQASPDLIGEMVILANQVAKKEGLEKNGFRMVINTHPDGGQSVYHLHIHILGGRQMKWPPG